MTTIVRSYSFSTLAVTVFNRPKLASPPGPQLNSYSCYSVNKTTTPPQLATYIYSLNKQAKMKTY